MAPITVNIKASNDKKYTVEIDSTKTILELKQAIESVAAIEPSKQRLIYSGRVLSKDEDTVEAYKVKDGNTIHLVQSKAAPSTTDTGSAAPSVPMSAGTNASNPLEQISGARYAGRNVAMPSPSLFGPDGGMTGGFLGPDEFAGMLEQPGVRGQLESAFSDPAFIDQMISSNPQLQNAPPYVRQMLQSPEFRRQLLDPNFMRQMSQMRQAMGQGAPDSSFPAPGQVQGAAPGGNTTNSTGQQSVLPDIGTMLQMLPGGMPSAQTGDGNAQAGPNPFQAMMQNPGMMQQMQQMMGGFGAPPSAAAAASEPADSRPPEERYAEQLRQLNDMGFFEFDRNVTALRRAGGSVQGAIEALLNGSV